MGKATDNVTEEILSELRDLKPDGLKEVLDFVLFLKVKRAIDPSQAYFWTRTWQRWEKEADKGKRAGRVVGDGTVEGLMKALKT